MMIIKWGSSIYMSAAIDVTAVPSLYTQIFRCEIKLKSTNNIQHIYYNKYIL